MPFRPDAALSPVHCSCGDQKHLDLSYSAFDVIARRDRGVVDLKMRPVSCDLQGQTVYYSGPGYGKQDDKGGK